MHLFFVVPDDKAKEIPKMREELVKQIEKEEHNVWIYIKTNSDVWEYGMDSKFDILSAVAMSFPLHDKGLLKSLRVAEVHKTLVLQKFERYVVSYVIAGSLVRGETTKTSDVDAFIIINDTDVKRMPRLELKERLRGIIYQYISEAYAIAGVKENILNVHACCCARVWDIGRLNRVAHEVRSVPAKIVACRRCTCHSVADSIADGIAAAPANVERHARCGLGCGIRTELQHASARTMGAATFQRIWP